MLQLLKVYPIVTLIVREVWLAGMRGKTVGTGLVITYAMLARILSTRLMF